MHKTRTNSQGVNRRGPVQMRHFLQRPRAPRAPLSWRTATSPKSPGAQAPRSRELIPEPVMMKHKEQDVQVPLKEDPRCCNINPETQWARQQAPSESPARGAARAGQLAPARHRQLPVTESSEANRGLQP